MPQWTDNVTIRGGATPHTFDGNQTVRFDEDAERITGISIGQSQSAWTTDEGFVMAVKLSENSGLGSKNPIFIMGYAQDSGPATNHAAQSFAPDYIGLDIPVSGNSTMRIDVGTVAGATQTGTHDCSITIHYDAGDTPDDILYAAAAARGMVPVKGGTYGYVTALATTTETACTGNSSTLNIPAEAQEIVAVCAHKVLDSAVTQLEEQGGKVRFEIGGVKAGKQVYPLSGGSPNIGTEVNGGNPTQTRALPMYIPCGNSGELQVSAYITFLSAITGGAEVAVNLLWR